MNSASDDAGRHQLPHRPSLEFSNQSIIQFVTICVHKRRPLLTRPEVMQLLLQSWQIADHWLVGRWVLMPDHLHLFCSPARFPNTPLKSWAYFWRNHTTRLWPFADEKPIWQRDFFDRQLRNGESYDQKWDYLWGNPIKEGLIKDRAKWPYQGELNVLPWHDANELPS